VLSRDFAYVKLVGHILTVALFIMVDLQITSIPVHKKKSCSAISETMVVVVRVVTFITRQI
jgi:hypothetical protein